MVATPIVSYQDGPRITVNDLIKSPTVVPRRIIDITANKFVADKILRNGGSAPSGVVKYSESTPLFSNSPSEIVQEFGQIPVSTNDVGALFVTQTQKRGLGVRISREMADRNDIDAVNLQITQVSNTMIRDWDGLFMAVALAKCASSGHTSAATAAWDNVSAATRKDIATAKYQIATSVAANQAANFLGFNADTLVLNLADILKMEGNDDTWKAWIGGNIADQNPMVTGDTPLRLFGLNVLPTFNIPAGTALVCESKTLGFISDERPLQSTPLYYNEDVETWRSNTVRTSAIGIDQPLAMATITGI
jgi:hypothetical protein